MGEQLVLVCDTCGRPAVQSVTFRIGNRNRVKDYCAIHLAELEAGSRAPRRGRKPAVVAASSTGKRRGRPPGSKSKTASPNGRRRKTSAKAT
jgi:hypothetical protein